MMKLLPPAKVNLFLRVIGKRDDGYHGILSLIQPISLYDEISLEVRDGDGITVRAKGAGVPPRFPVDERNLAYRAGELFLKEAGVKKEVIIDMDKKIPVGAGLGGGSSDAASVIMGLNEMLNAGFNEKKLMDIALSIGSDAPFFILKGPAVARGRGEILERVALEPLNYVLINPGFSVSTAWVYGNLDLTKKDEGNILIDLKEPGPETIVKYLANDLEDVTLRKYPALRELKGILMESGAMGAMMSGSGPTVFGVFRDEAKAVTARADIEARLGPPYRVFFARGLQAD
ncbi:MAG: 4-(cytidine 5'-diphospho)-2-C-methyl-D-erythritol kinase [Deltaproteobacteria bacterium]|nr:4-(cytidine 5'-diphospho)-2-C-methyl-D-erythritol kinase [Deltaproteobacteria bacterium]